MPFAGLHFPPPERRLTESSDGDVHRMMKEEAEALKAQNRELASRIDALLVNRIGEEHVAARYREKARTKDKQEKDLETNLRRQREKSERSLQHLKHDEQRLQVDLAAVKRDLYHAQTMLGVAPDMDPLQQRLRAAKDANALFTRQIKDLTVSAFSSSADQRIVSEQRLKELEELLQKKAADCDAMVQERIRLDGETDQAKQEGTALDQQCRTLMEENERLDIRREEKQKAVRTAQAQLEGTLENLDDEDRKVIVFSLQFMREREDAMAAAEAARRGEAPPPLSHRSSIVAAGMPNFRQSSLPPNVAEMTICVDNLRAEKDDLAQELRAVQDILHRERFIHKDLTALHNLDVNELAQQVRATVADTARCRRLAQDREKRIQELRLALAKRREKAEPAALRSGAVERAPDVVSEAGFSGLSDIEGKGNALDVYLTLGRLEERALLELPQQVGEESINPERALVTLVVVEFMNCEAGFTEEASGLRPRYDSLVSFGPFDVDDPVVEHFARGAMRMELQAFSASAQTAYTLGRASLPLASLLDCTPQDPNPIVAGTLVFASASDDRIQIASVQYKARWRKPVLQAIESYSRSKGTTASAAVAAAAAKGSGFGARAFGGLMDATKTLLVHIGGVTGLVPARAGAAPNLLRPYVSYEIPGHREHFTKTATGPAARFEDVSKMVVRVDAEFCKWAETGGGMHFLVFDATAPDSGATSEEQLGLLGELKLPVAQLLTNPYAQIVGSYPLQRSAPAVGGVAAPQSVGFLDVGIRWHDDSSAVLAPGLGGPSVTEADHRGAAMLTDQQYQIIWQHITKRLMILHLSTAEWFYQHDTDKDGRWSRDEVRAALAQMPVGLSVLEVDQVFARMDTKRTQLLTLDDVTAAMAEGAKAAPLEQWVRDVYRSIADALSSQRLAPDVAFRSVAPSGKAQKREFFALATSLDLGLRPEQLEWLWKLSDVNSDGLLDFSEFAARLRDAASTGTTAFTLPRPTAAERGVGVAEAPTATAADGSGMPQAWYEFCLTRIIRSCRDLGLRDADAVVNRIELREDKLVSRAELITFCLRMKARMSDWEVDHVFMALDVERKGAIAPPVLRTALLLCDVSDSQAQAASRRAAECFGQMRHGLMKKLPSRPGEKGATQQDFLLQLRAIFLAVATQKEPLIANRGDFLAVAVQLAPEIGEARLQELWYAVEKLRDNSVDIDGLAARLYATPFAGEGVADGMTDKHYTILLGRLQRALQRRGLGSAEAAFRSFARNDGCLTPAQLEEGLRQTVDIMSAQERRSVANRIDTNKDGLISLGELQTALTRAQVAALSGWAEDVCMRVSASLRRHGWTTDELFDSLAKRTGTVHWPDFKLLFAQIEPSLSEDQLVCLWQNFDKNGDGGVSRDEFKRALAVAEAAEAASLPGGELSDVSARVSAALRRRGGTPDELFKSLAKGGLVVLWQEFRGLFADIEPSLSEEDLRRLWRTYDKDSDGGVSCDEFRRALAVADAAAAASLPTGELRVVCERVVASLQRKGWSQDELYDALAKGLAVRWLDCRALFAELEPSLGEDQLQKLWQTFDKDGDGTVSRQELKRVLAAPELARAGAIASTDVLVSRVGRAFAISGTRLSATDALRFYDATAEGSLDLSQWLAACKGLRLPLAPAEAVALHRALARGPTARLPHSVLEAEITNVTVQGVPDERWVRDLIKGRARLAAEHGAPSLYDALSALAGGADVIDEASMLAVLGRHAGLPDEQWKRMRLLLERRPEDGHVLWKLFLNWACSDRVLVPMALPSATVEQPLPPPPPRPVEPSAPAAVPPPAPVIPAAPASPHAAKASAPVVAATSATVPPAAPAIPAAAAPPGAAKAYAPVVAATPATVPPAAPTIPAAAPPGAAKASAPVVPATPAMVPPAAPTVPGAAPPPGMAKAPAPPPASPAMPPPAPAVTQHPPATGGAKAALAAPVPPAPKAPTPPVAAPASPEVAKASAPAASAGASLPTDASAAGTSELAEAIIKAVAEVVNLREGDARSQLRRFDRVGAGRLDRAAFDEAMRWYSPSLQDLVLTALWNYIVAKDGGVDGVVIDRFASRLQPQWASTSAADQPSKAPQAGGGPLWVALRKVRAAFHEQHVRLRAAFDRFVPPLPGETQPRRLTAAGLVQGLSGLGCKLADEEVHALYGGMAPQPHVGATSAEFEALFSALGPELDVYVRELYGVVGAALVNRNRGSVSSAFQMLDLAGDGEVGKGNFCAVVSRFGDINLTNAQLDRVWELACSEAGPGAVALNFETFKRLLCADLDTKGASAPETKPAPSLEHSCEHLDRLGCLPALRLALFRRDPDGILTLQQLVAALNEAAPQLAGAEVEQVVRLATRKGGPLRGEDAYDFRDMLTRFESGQRDWHPLDLRERVAVADLCRYIKAQAQACGYFSLTQRLAAVSQPLSGAGATIATMPLHELLAQLSMFLIGEAERRLAEMLLLRLGRVVSGIARDVDLAEFCARFEQLAMGHTAADPGGVSSTGAAAMASPATPPAPSRNSTATAQASGANATGVPLHGEASGGASGGVGPSPPVLKKSCARSSWPLDLRGQQRDELALRLRREAPGGVVRFHPLVRMLMEAKIPLRQRQEQELKKWMEPFGHDYCWVELFAFAVVVEKLSVTADKATRRLYSDGLQLQVSFCNEVVVFEPMPWKLGLVGSYTPTDFKTMTLTPNWHALFVLDGPSRLSQEDLVGALVHRPPPQSHRLRITLFGLQPGDGPGTPMGLSASLGGASSSGPRRVFLGETELCVADEVPKTDLRAGVPGRERAMAWRPGGAAPGSPARRSTSSAAPRISVTLGTRNASRLYDAATAAAIANQSGAVGSQTAAALTDGTTGTVGAAPLASAPGPTGAVAATAPGNSATAFAAPSFATAPAAHWAPVANPAHAAVAAPPSSVPSVAVPAHMVPDVPSGMIRATQGQYTLAAGARALAGTYIWQQSTSSVVDLLTGKAVGKFSCEPISQNPYPLDVATSEATRELPCISIVDSEIMAEIQKGTNDGAFFVLPSQLNGAEYPSHGHVVHRIEEYTFDNTGGPRGQLAVHPAVGQFILDNAACENCLTGINAVDKVLEQTAAFGFRLVNGYLEVPRIADTAAKDRALAAFRGHIHTLRPLVMEGVPALGLTPDKQALSGAGHNVSLVYASAVPVQAYLNEGDPAFETAVAEAVLVAQYHGALKVAARRASGNKKKIFLMPLGGGVFNNPWHSIAKSMAIAVELLGAEDLAKLDIHALTWSGNATEKRQLEALLRQHGKLAQ